MAKQLYSNNADSTLSASITNIATSLTVQAGDGAKFPNPTGGDWFLLTLAKVTSGIENTVEIVKVTARSGDVMTIVRAQEGTTASAYSTNDRASHRNTAATMTALALKSGDTFTSPTINGATVDGLNGGPLGCYRSRIINGNFDIWQRGTSFSVGGGGAYVADRFLAATVGCTGSVAQTVFSPGSQASQNTGARYGMTITGAAGLSYAVVQTSIEGVKAYEGKQVTVSLFCDQPMPTGAYIRAQQIFGSGGSTTVTQDTNMASAAAGSQYVWTATFTVPSISGKTVGAGDCLQLLLVYIPPVVTVPYTFYGFKIEPGSVRTPFEQHEPALELLACQRYYQLAQVGLMGIAISASSVYVGAQLPVPMRAAPTIGNPTAVVTVNDGSANSTQSSVGTATTISATQTGVVCQLSNFSGLTTNRPLIVTGGGAIPLNADY